MADIPSIELIGVSCRYKRSAHNALDTFSFLARRGEFVVVTGTSGSGKSTFLRLCSMEVRSRTGRVNLLGQDVTRIPRRNVHRVRRHVATVFQDHKLLVEQTLAENVAFPLEMAGHRPSLIRERTRHALEAVGLGDMGDRLVKETSGGEQQRTAIARALALEPQILLADEPTGNLDPSSSRGVVDLLHDLSKQGTCIVLVTHDHESVAHTATRNVRIEAGAVLDSGSVETGIVP